MIGNPLAEFTLAELFQEIANRSDVAFAACTANLNKDGERWITFQKGSKLVIRGMLASISAQIDSAARGKSLDDPNDWLHTGLDDDDEAMAE